MREEDDAFGQALLDQLEGRGGFEIIEREDGFVWVSSPIADYFYHHPLWPSEQKRAMQHVRGRVLDIGCGAGSHSLYLQGKKDVDVVGIDVSPGAVEVCRRRGVRDVRQLSIAQVNASLGTFETILMLGNNFGLLENAESARRTLTRFLALTSPKARIIAESLDPYRTDDPCHLVYHDLNRRRGRLPGQVRVRIRYKRLKTRWFDYLFVSKEEMEDLVAGTGWHVRKSISAGGPGFVTILDKS